jgi:tetratricopeptide (TPR) repeat protein
MKNKNTKVTKNEVNKPVTRPVGDWKSNFNYSWILASLVLVMVVFWLYRPSFDHAFVNWDDQVYVEEQPLVLHKEYNKLLKTPVSLNYHPITMWSLAWQAPKSVQKLTPAPFIKLNVALHIMNTLLVFIFLSLLFGKSLMIASWLAAAVFALHPMHVESVVWVSERKDVLYTFFLLLSCIGYLKYVQTNKTKWIVLAGILFLLSVMSKAMAVVIPLIWVMIDYLQGRKLSDVKVWLEKIPFLLISLLFGLMAISVQSGHDFGGWLTLYGEKTKAVADTGIFSLWERIQFATYGFFTYLHMFFNPSKICAFYPYPDKGFFTGPIGYLLPILFLLLTLFVLWYGRKNKIVTFGFGFYFINIALVLQFLSVGLAIMADRYTYVSFIGLAFMFFALVQKAVSSRAASIQYSALGISVLFILLLTLKTKSQVEIWKDSETLWTQVLKYYPNEDLALANRGNHRGKTGNIEGAMADFSKAIADGCTKFEVYEGLGNSYGTLSQQQTDKKDEYIPKAIEMYKKAIALNPENGNIYYNLGVTELQVNPAKAEKTLNDALRLMPYRSAEILPVLGISQINSGQFKEAIASLTKAIEMNVKTEQVYNNRGIAFLALGDKAAAKADFSQVLLLNPNNVDVKTKLAGM